MRNNIALFFLACSAFGCGTIVHGGSQRLPVTSTPPGATARVACNDGTSAQVTTPAALVIPRNAEGCTVTVEKSGYRPENVALRRGKSAAMVGNVGTSAVGAIVGVIAGAVTCAVAHTNSSTFDTCAAAGGVAGLLFPGWLDARTGAMYTQHPDRIDVVLQPLTQP
jgi:hypothetical protein